MERFRAVLNFVVAGALAGILVVTLIGPRFIEWDNTAGNGAGMCICGVQARVGADTLITYQMRGTVLGAALGVVVGVAYVLMRRRSTTNATA
jgi:hypothetical protein